MHTEGSSARSPPPTAGVLAHWSVTSPTVPTKEDISFSETKPISLRFPSKRIRAYQRELAQPGLNGENYIICAPTGCGKTLVATIIISEHFRQRQERGERGKVIFMVKTQQLAHQQKERLEQDLEGARVTKVVGDSELLLASLVPSIDLIVCTAGKLCNELRAKMLTMGQFSLLVVDECHHTVGSDYYSEVMEFYLLEKLRGDPSKVPQVIGLTASPGAGKGKSPTLVKAINHQFDLCAHLDASSGIKMVTENMEELLANTNKPDHILTVLEHRSCSEPFYGLILNEMERLESLIKGVPPFNRHSFQYGKWIELEKEAAEMRKSSEERNRISILEHLSLYYLALITYEDFNSEDAIEVLKGKEEYPEEQATPTEQDLNVSHATLLSQLSHLPVVSNPLLIGVEDILVNQFSKTPESKGIFFVREIRHTQYVQRWVESRPNLRSLVRIASIMGYTRAGMTKEHQLEVIRGFREGKYNLLVSTSILEEGIDVAACNLVIRFQVMSNEIAEVQAQGRARAIESMMYTIISSQSDKEFHQIIIEEKKELALKAPSFVTDLCMSPKFKAKQEEILIQRDTREKALATRKQLWKPEDVSVVCKKCKTTACMGNDVFLFEVTYHVVPSSKFRETKMERRPHHRARTYGNVHFCYKIYCRKCSQDWGVWVWSSKQCLQFPVLKCESFTFHHKDDVHRGKKWGEVPFTIPQLPEDFDYDN